MLEVGTVVTTKKNHACGNNKWEIIRSGADYKLKCLKCERVILICGFELLKKIKVEKTKD